MNDPHVVALVYQIKNRRSIIYQGEKLSENTLSVGSLMLLLSKDQGSST